MTERVNHPAHYNDYPIEAIELCEELSFNLGNALKYVWRSARKPRDEDKLLDLKKALWYLKRESERVFSFPEVPQTGDANWLVELAWLVKDGRPTVGVPRMAQKLFLVTAKLAGIDPLLKQVLEELADDTARLGVTVETVQQAITVLEKGAQ